MDGLKVCTKCGETKPRDQFSKHKLGRDGLRPSCKMCCAKEDREWRAKNRERVIERAAAYRKANPEKFRARAKAYYRRNAELCRERHRQWRENNQATYKAAMKRWREANPEHNRRNVARWQRENPDKVHERNKRWQDANRDKRREYVARYRAAKRKQIPSWLTDEHVAEIRALYAQASQDRHVDHIWPLRGKDAWGLHVPWNLQLLSARLNCSKGNKPPETAT